MHPKAMEKIKRIIEGALQNSVISNRWPQYNSYVEHINSLAKEVVKHKGQWLKEVNLFSIFPDHVYKAVSLAHPEEDNVSGNLKNYLDEDQLDNLSETIFNYIISIPREYDVYLPLPSVDGIDFEILEIYPGVWIKRFSDPDEIPGGSQDGILGLLSTGLQVNKVYLCTRVKGYSGGWVEDSCTREAFSRFKLLIHTGLHRNLFVLDESRSVSFGLFGQYANHQIPKISLVSVDLLRSNDQMTESQLPLNLTIFFHKICLNVEMDFVKNAIESSEEQFKLVLLNGLTKSAQIAQQKNEDVGPIKSAIEWAIDSKAQENYTMSFIQNCIGLECILGDDMDNLTVTSTLADRCAYLIGTDPKERKNIRRKFKKLYEIRSKLVHGKVMNLEDDTRKHHHWGQFILDLAISKEIKNYRLE